MIVRLTKVGDLYYAHDETNGKVIAYDTNRQEVLNNAIYWASIIIIDSSFKTEKELK